MAPPQLGWFASAELYDPASRTFSPTGFMRWRRDDPVAVLLRDGRVLVTGGTDFDGNNLRTAEIYDPATGKFTTTGSMATARDGYSATVLADGRVLIAGGVDQKYEALASAEIYDPASGKFTTTGSMGTARSGYAAVLLRNGQVLIAGGTTGGDTDGTPLSSAELFDSAAGTFTPTGQMADARTGASAALLSDGRVVIAGGQDDVLVALQSAEMYQP